jgi:NADPH2:quinone reductase
MKAAWYEKQGPAREVLVVGEMDTPMPGEGEVRIRIEASGINPGDVRKRQDAFGVGMPFPRIVPHSDGAGTVDAVGAGVPDSWIGQRVWCYGAQTYRPFGTAAGYAVVPLRQAILLPAAASMEQGACLGIPGITAYRAVQIAGDLAGKTVLVQGGAGAVGACAVQLAHRAGARVIATCRARRSMDIAAENGADHVLLMDEDLVRSVQAIATDGVDHIVEVAFGENIELDLQLLALGGSIAAYATHAATPQIPFWELLFKNVSIHLVGSDDVPADIKADAAHALNRAIEAGWTGLRIAERFALEDIALAHERVERGALNGRIVLTV